MTRRCFTTALLGLPLVAAQDDPPPPVVAPPSPLENPTGPVWLESLLKAPGVRYDGNLVFSPRKALVNGERFAHAMSVDVKDDPLGPGQSCGMTIPLMGKFARFQAMVGRDDEETAAGTAFCYFEVYADNKLLFRSDAIRSSLHRVLTVGGENKRLRPQSVDVEVKGVRLLRLVVRYANDFKQQAVEQQIVKRASGCLWYDAKLIPAEGGGLDTERLKERDERIRTAARLAARTLRRQLQMLERSGPKVPVGILPIRDDFRVSPDDPLIRPQLAKVLFGGDPADGKAVGDPLPSEKAAELRETLRNFSPKSLRQIAFAAEQGRYAGAPYLVAGYIEDNKLFLVLLDTRPEEGLIVGNATGWLNPP